MEQNKILQIVYTFFVGILLAIFVGVGINTFYTPPTAPQTPVEINPYGKELTDKQIQQQQAFEKQDREYQDKMKPYNRNVSAIAMTSAVALLALSILFERKIKIISDGVMLGGLFTLIYGIGRGFASEDSKYLFILVTTGLVLVLFLGYHRFVKLHESTTKKPQNSEKHLKTK